MTSINSIVQTVADIQKAVTASLVATLAAQAAVVTATAAPSASAPSALTVDAVVGTIPAGGTGAAAGGWDTANNRDAAIATITDALVVIAELIVDITALRATVAALVTDNVTQNAKIDAILASAKAGALMASS